MEFLLDDPDFSDVNDGNRAAREAQRAYITAHLQRVEDALFAEDFADDDGAPYSDYIDLDSAASYWWVQEFSSNLDAFRTSSTYLYKARDTVLDNERVVPGKIYWGPLWDLDLAYDYASGDEGQIAPLCTTTAMPWLDRMRALDPAYQQLLRDKWPELRGIVDDITKDGGVLDQYAAEIKASWKCDYDLWRPRTYIPVDSLESAISSLKNGLSARSAAIDGSIDEELTRVYATITFMLGDEVVKECPVRRGMQLDEDVFPDDPVKEGYFFLGWADEDGSYASAYQSYMDDAILRAVMIPDEDVIRPKAIYFDYYERWTSLNDDSRYIYFTTIPETVQDTRYTWTSSNPAVATVNYEGCAQPLSVDETTITCTVANGVSQSMVLHVYDPQATPAQTATSMKLSQTSLIMLPGEAAQVVGTFAPQPAELSLNYESSDESVAIVDDLGVVQAKSPGSCIVTVTEEESGMMAQCTMTVIDPDAVARAKDELRDKIAEATRTMASGTYTDESLTALEQAIADVNRAIDDDYATEEMLAASRTELLRALRQLTPVNQETKQEVAPDKPAYRVASGADSAYMEGSGEPLVFTFKRTVDDQTSFDHFMGILVDGKAVPEKNALGTANWTARRGSVIVALQPSFLATLPAGVHTVTALFDDGDPATADFSVSASATHTVTFDANGHGKAPDAQEVEHGGKAKKPANPTADGWIFAGWYTDRACDEAYDFSTPVTEDITLYAKWIKRSSSGSGTSAKSGTSPKTGDPIGGIVVALSATAAAALFLVLFALSRRRRRG